jgi:hypothetical protein
MNARLYDPVLGRMISPDNFVNGAFGTQGYNRYSYAKNNPLSYIDPSGNEPITIVGILLAVLKGAAISAGINATMQVIQNGGFDNFNWGSFGMAALQGGIGGGLSNVIGGFVQGLHLGNFDAAILGASLHTMSGGVQSAIFGGDPFQGMVSGAIGSVAGSIGVSTGLSKSLVGSFVIGGVPAAITAQIMGGDPFQAFITAGTVAAFNHYLHKISQEITPLYDKEWLDGYLKYQHGSDYKNRLNITKIGLGEDYNRDYPNGGKVSTNENKLIKYNPKTGLFSDGKTAGITTNYKGGSAVYIGKYMFGSANQLHYITTHEMIHSLHNCMGLNNNMKSEYSARSLNLIQAKEFNFTGGAAAAVMGLFMFRDTTYTWEKIYYELPSFSKFPK